MMQGGQLSRDRPNYRMMRIRAMVLRPIVVIPGFGGSVLVKQGQTHKRVLGRQVLHNRWMQMYPFMPKKAFEWKHDMAYGVARDPGTKKIIGLNGYSERGISAYDLGGTRGIKDIVPEFLFLGDTYRDTLNDIFHFRYFHKLCDRLYTEGYEDYKNLVGIPYDFRLVLDPAYRTWLFDVFRVFLEDVRQRNGGLPAVVVTHSLGGILLKWFLEGETAEWIEENISKIVMISPPFGGASFALRAVMSGDHYIKMFHKTAKEELQRNSGIIMCLPNEAGDGKFIIDRPKAIRGTGENLMGALNHRSYGDLASTMLPFEIWRDLYEPYLRPMILRPMRADLSKKLVQIVISSARETAVGYVSEGTDIYPHTEIKGLGDGVLSNKSLQSAMKIFPNAKILDALDVDHTRLVSDERVIRSILDAAKER